MLSRATTGYSLLSNFIMNPTPYKKKPCESVSLVLLMLDLKSWDHPLLENIWDVKVDLLNLKKKKKKKKKSCFFFLTDWLIDSSSRGIK